MLTPSFDVSQSESLVTVTLRVPYVKISEAEVHIEGRHFKFYCTPYFLHLQLPGELAQDDQQNLETTTYDADTGTMTIRVLKRNHGEQFANLEMLTTLLPRKQTELRKVGEKPSIEVVEPGASAAEGEGQVGGTSEEGEEFDWGMEQSFPSEDDKDLGVLVSGQIPYGFALQHQGVFLKLQEEIPSIVDCPDPDHMTPRERRIGRIAHEEAAFSQDHYLADLMDNEFIQVLLDFVPLWKPQLSKWRHEIADSGKKGEPGPDLVPFSAAQRDQLKSLKNTEYLFDKATKHSLYLGLVDIIFAYAYNLRSTEGEGNVESAWTICKLSSTLSWLEVFRGAVHEVVYCSLRRSLCYPLYRNWALSLAVLQDTRELFRLGRRKLLQCMLEIRETLNSSEPYYILNNLYITDYAIWLQRARRLVFSKHLGKLSLNSYLYKLQSQLPSVKCIQSLADELDEVKVEMGSVGWGLVELEEAARLTLQEEEGGKGDTQQDAVGAGNTGPPDQGDDMEFIAGQLQQISLAGKGAETGGGQPLIQELQDTGETSGETQTTSDTTESETESTSSESDDTTDTSQQQSEPQSSIT